MKNLLFNLKAVQTGTYKAEVGAGAGSGTFSSLSRSWSRNKYLLNTALCERKTQRNVIDIMLSRLKC